MTTAEITTLAGAIALGLLQAWNTCKQSNTARTVDQIHTLTNSAMGQSKKMLAEVTAAKAAITKLPADQNAADAALSDYVAHMGKQSNVDLGIKT